MVLVVIFGKKVKIMFHLWTKRQSDNYVIFTTEIYPDIFGYSFETMIYNDNTQEFLDFQERYKNCTQALNGHIRTIRKLDEILCKEGK